MQPNEWHQRFKIQSEWTKPVQSYLLQPIPNLNQLRALEIGCGTGAILQRLQSRFHTLVGLDINFDYLDYAGSHLNNPLVCGDGYALPFSDESFGLACCHFLLLWISEPQDLLAEVYRILKPGGDIILFAEPDYGGRIDYPTTLHELGAAQTNSLKKQGADPYVGRKLPQLLAGAGFSDIEAGILGNQWQPGFDQKQWQSEWDMFEHDLQGEIPPEKLGELKQIDRKAYLAEERVLFIPTFYAKAKK